MSPVSAADVVAALRAAGQTVATAESLTGGLVCATLVDVPGASDVVRGAVVAYQPDVKTAVLGVDADLIAREGTVNPAVAEQLALGVRDRLGATWGLGTTGVAGPGPSEGHPPGTVHLAVAGPDGVVSRRLELSGDRDAVRRSAVRAVLADLHYRLGKNSGPTDVEPHREGGGDDRDA
ncbi:competence protein [Aeromicrobium flavum]|uniref:Competence protein n=1 Tax=Aeromicrobium flavum TaxID=416568 RepID=A0A512HWY1_9ACTN|nr:CinA family protein [Aeromicrobium flavum]GEO89966.1 competence protein [Aeromicrobium flavum]